jgi:hypothetical protein
MLPYCIPSDPESVAEGGPEGTKASCPPPDVEAGGIDEEGGVYVDEDDVVEEGGVYVDGEVVGTDEEGAAFFLVTRKYPTPAATARAPRAYFSAGSICSQYL